MVIGHYIPRLWENGGIGTYIRRLSEAQRAAGHEVIHLDLADAVREADRREGTVYCPAESAVATTARSRGVEVLHVHRDFPIEEDGGLAIVRTIHDHSPYCPSGGRYLKQSDRPCDRAYSLAGCFRGHVVDRCGSVRPQSLMRNFATTRREMRRLPRITTIVSSRFVYEQMVREGYDSQRLVHIPMPAPAAVEQITPLPRQAAVRFVFLGRLVRHKGMEWLLRNLAMTEGICLDVAGEGNELEALKQLTAGLSLGDRVTFHGWVDRAGTQSLLDAARALIVPSRWHEPFGLVSLEAMARGRAVIASNTGALPEVVIDGKTGIVVNVEQADGLAAAMRRLAEDSRLADQLGLAGRQRARELYSMDNHLRGVIDVYRNARVRTDIPTPPAASVHQYAD